MGRRTAAALLCAALWLSACASDVAPQSSAATTVPDPGRELTITVTETVKNEDGTDTVVRLDLEGRAWGSGTDYVILGHMRPADMTSWFDFGRVLAEQGYTAIAFNFRGYGKSEAGENGEFAVGNDMRAAVDAALAEGAQRIYLIGASMGGTGAVAAASDRDIEAVVTLSAPDEFEGVNAAVLAERVESPMLLIAADADGTAADDASAIASGAKGETELVVLSGDQHGTNLFADHREELTKLILEFLEAA